MQKCLFCNEEREVNEFGCCKECWNRILIVQNLIYGGPGINPYRMNGMTNSIKSKSSMLVKNLASLTIV